MDLNSMVKKIHVLKLHKTHGCVVDRLKVNAVKYYVRVKCFIPCMCDLHRCHAHEHG